MYGSLLFYGGKAPLFSSFHLIKGREGRERGKEAGTGQSSDFRPS